MIFAAPSYIGRNIISVFTGGKMFLFGPFFTVPESTILVVCAADSAGAAGSRSCSSPVNRRTIFFNRREAAGKVSHSLHLLEHFCR
jgi:hypothetical protein